jgi:hypothetical protein
LAGELEQGLLRTVAIRRLESRAWQSSSSTILRQCPCGLDLAPAHVDARSERPPLRLVWRVGQQPRREPSELLYPRMATARSPPRVRRRRGPNHGRTDLLAGRCFADLTPRHAMPPHSPPLPLPCLLLRAAGPRLLDGDQSLETAPEWRDGGAGRGRKEGIVSSSISGRV